MRLLCAVLLVVPLISGCAAMTVCYDTTKLVVRTTAAGVKGGYRLGKEGVGLATRPMRDSQKRNWPGPGEAAPTGGDPTIVADAGDTKPGRGRVTIGDGAPRRSDSGDVRVDLPPLDIDAILAKSDGAARKR